ncbi:gibberellin 2-beta-dioxygenase 1-like [Andrographis paniculata]|uniref:gibberellin 2-beta-dioxygenase 1-like n=1 Tax=Andrographis paniculata TaxID=175694 RepID=UPI0021E8CDA4|nr:gibberellin 2-beta-dioxygenase 1-like [Andrographis paniculata]
MVVQSKTCPCNPITEQTFIPPLLDLAQPPDEARRAALVRACEDLGFFKVINHGVPLHVIQSLESHAKAFFSHPQSHKSQASPTPPDPFGYGHKSIGLNGDVGWLEYLLLNANSSPDDYRKFSPIFPADAARHFRGVVNEYIGAVKKMACEILEMLAEGLKVEERDAFSKLLMDEQNDSVFRLNHYPPSSDGGEELIGFGEHTDPQIISVLRSNDTCGLQIFLNDHHRWISIPPDHNSFFINVGDSLQVMTNGRFKSVRHRVVANGAKSRVSMIYFGGPPLSEKIAPLPSLIKGDDDSLYKEFTWFEYKKTAYKSRLADNRLGLFEKIAAS